MKLVEGVFLSTQPILLENSTGDVVNKSSTSIVKSVKAVGAELDIDIDACVDSFYITLVGSEHAAAKSEATLLIKSRGNGIYIETFIEPCVGELVNQTNPYIICGNNSEATCKVYDISKCRLKECLSAQGAVMQRN